MRQDCCNIVRYSDCLHCSCGGPIWEKTQGRFFTPSPSLYIYIVTYISAGIQLYKSPEGGQLKNQQPSKSPSSASAQKRAFSSCCGTKGMCGNASQRHSFISWLSKHPQRNIWILMCTLSLICLWNMNINLGKRGLISNRALTWNV